jgi:hypothetical protein
MEGLQVLPDGTPSQMAGQATSEWGTALRARASDPGAQSGSLAVTR